MSKWKVLKSINAFKAGFFALRVDECQLPDERIMPRYYVMEFPDWVNVVPITDDGKMILVEQYRHAAGETCLEIPGGSTSTKVQEEPLLAAKRELKEETGFEAREWIYCGFHYPNPALQNNKMHTYLAIGCRKVSDPHLDPFEDLQVKIMDAKKVFEELESGKITHSLIAASLSLARRFVLDKI